MYSTIRVRPASRASHASGRRSARSLAALALAGAAAAAVLTGCSTQDAICGGGEYPVLHVGSSGSACQPDGEEPPKGYARYPEGKVPEHVDDKWDKYWSDHTLDSDGKIIKLKDGQ
ncbi:SCO0607 family lipoprotein [Streptomyces venezuelae]|uniref:SCO0607 family lipoprotein n=1 Tax=Streptomyces venezuelae TaxID=54571 RepID=UPI003988EBB7